MQKLLVGLALSFAVGACTSDSTLHVDNESDFVITDMYVTDVGSSTWGPNLLGADGLNPGETLAIDVSCGTYDVQLIDETGVTCEVDDLDLCLNDALWVIHNDTCSTFREAAAAKGLTPTSPTSK
ncbi:MAG: hypothetical protein QM831_25595 [Kofleriaceae bacterium]